ncbi:MAG: Lrp/AsnC family transcriptional regulator [archaeon]
MLTKNDRKALKLLLHNARISDSDIAAKLNISSQAVGKIRKKLEQQIIERYTLELNYAKLGVQIFAVVLAKLTKEGMDKGILEVEHELAKHANVLRACKIPNGNHTHIILYGFKDIQELDSFFNAERMRQNLHKYLESQDVYMFSNKSIIKNNPRQLFERMVDELGENPLKPSFRELENFKRRL